MTRKSNTGVSMVEILIALAIFVALLTPIVSSLITSMQTTTSAKETQYRNEYARNLMENVKGMPISVLQDAVAAENYFASLGATVTDVQIKPKDAVNNYDTYVIKGTTNIGTEHTQYAYAIEISGNGYELVNDQKSGVVEDLDQTDVALISAPFSNYDYSAYDALLTKKLAAVRMNKKNNNLEFDPAEDVKAFAGNQCDRVITLEVEGNDNSGYTIACRSTYTDGTESVEYTSYAQTFDELPHVYLMYNTCIYNGLFAKSDTLTYDVNIPNDKELKVFVVTTSEKYSDDYKDWAGLKATDTDTVVTLNRDDPGDVLYRTDAGSIDKYVLTFADDTSVGGKVHIYCDLDDVDNPGDEEDIDAVYGAVMHDKLNAVQDGRGLYKVKIWMQPGADIDLQTNTLDPVLEGTRGGDEIE